jgi:hypothetical protein
VHVREPHGGKAQSLHADAITDVRPDAFDMQLTYYPQHVTLEMGGTLSVPGSHLRRINETDSGRYRNLLEQDRLVCPTGTGVFVPRPLAWRAAQRQRHDPFHAQDPLQSDRPPAPAVGHSSDLDDPRVAAELRAWFPWYEKATGRLGPYNRVLLWWALTGGRQLRPRPLGDRVANRTQEAAR